MLCNWCHAPDVANTIVIRYQRLTLLWYRAGKTKRKCAISTLIFRKFSGGYAPRPHTGETPPRSALGASLGTFGPSMVVSPLIKMLATQHASRSSEVIDLGANRKRICNFLISSWSLVLTLVVMSYLVPLSRYRRMKLENSLFFPPLFDAPHRGTPANIRIYFISICQEHDGTTVNPIYTDPERHSAQCYRQTDRQTTL